MSQTQYFHPNFQNTKHYYNCVQEYKNSKIKPDFDSNNITPFSCRMKENPQNIPK